MVKWNLTKLTYNECAVSCISGQQFLTLARLRLLCSWTLQHDVRSSYHGSNSALFSEFFLSLPTFYLFVLFFLHFTDLVSVMDAGSWLLCGDFK